MNKEWKDLNQQVRNGIKLAKNSNEVENTISSWHQEARDLCLIMSSHLTTPVSLKLSRKHKASPIDRLKDDCELLVSEHILSCDLEIPDTASCLSVKADITRRTITCSMKLDAPKDKKRPTAKVNWLLKQLKHTNNEHIYITAITQGRSFNIQKNINETREDPDCLLNNENGKIDPIAFEISLVMDLAAKFSGRKTFIEGLECTVPNYYKEVGEHLRNWVAPAPKIKKDTIEINIEESEKIKAA